MKVFQVYQTPGLLMRPEKDEAKAEARKCEAEAKTYEAEATVSNESCNI